MKRSNVYANSASFKLQMTILASVLFSAAIASGSIFLVGLVGLALIGYVFYRVLTDPVKPPNG